MYGGRIFLVLPLFVFFGLCSGTLVVNSPISNGNISFDALPVVWSSNPLNFVPVNGFLILANQTEAWWAQNQAFFPLGMPNLVLVDFYPRERPYVEQRLAAHAARWNPSAVVFMGEYLEGVEYDLGKLDHSRQGFNTSAVTFPVVQTWWRTWYTLRPLLLNNSIINVTVTDEGYNAWRALRTSWWFPTWMTIGIVWCVTNMIFAIVAITFYPRERRLAVVVLWIEVFNNLLRIPFLVDPFGNYFMPIGIVQVWFSASWPLHVASCILIVLMWHELVSSSSINVRTQGFLTSSRIPAAIVIVVVCIVEWATACLRSAGLTGFIIYANAAVYFLVFGGCFFIYLYVYIEVYRFLKASAKLTTKNDILRRVSVRFLLMGVTLLLIIVDGCFIVSKYFNRALGQSIIHFVGIVLFCLGSSFTIAAFWAKPGLNSKTGKTTQKTSASAASSHVELGSRSL